MDIFDIAYLSGVGWLAAWELYALKKGDKQTISHKIWSWRNKKTWRRFGLLVGFIWIGWHIALK